jgi:hypothetical protein
LALNAFRAIRDDDGLAPKAGEHTVTLADAELQFGAADFDAEVHVLK